MSICVALYTHAHTNIAIIMLEYKDKHTHIDTYTQKNTKKKRTHKQTETYSSIYSVVHKSKYRMYCISLLTSYSSSTTFEESIYILTFVQISNVSTNKNITYISSIFIKSITGNK